MNTEECWPHRNRLEGAALRSAWADLLSRVPWKLFVTLTFDPKRVYPVSATTASREAFWWCGQTSRVLRSPVGWVYAPERGRSGQWHVHALLVGVPDRILASIEIWKGRNGFIDVQQVRDVRGVALYTTKAAALTGEVAWSDTLGRYRASLTDRGREAALHL